MAVLKQNPTLKDLQNYIKEVCEERGWNKNSTPETFLLFMEEVGELAKAIRNNLNLYKEKNKTKMENKFELEEEFADVLNYLLDLANQFNIDLESAFRRKEIINRERQWE